jgi:hypothetical protein
MCSIVISSEVCLLFFSWGRNQNGQLGLGTTDDSLLPQKIQAFEVQCFLRNLHVVYCRSRSHKRIQATFPSFDTLSWLGGVWKSVFTVLRQNHGIAEYHGIFSREDFVWHVKNFVLNTMVC